MKKNQREVRHTIWIEVPGGINLGKGRAMFLQKIEETGSIAEAAFMKVLRSCLINKSHHSHVGGNLLEVSREFILRLKLRDPRGAALCMCKDDDDTPGIYKTASKQMQRWRQHTSLKPYCHA